MSGRESRLVRLLVAEALLNLASSFALLQWLHTPVGAALGSLVPALIFGWCFLWPWAAREIGTTPVKLLRTAVVPALRAALPLVAFGAACRFVPLLDFRRSIPVFFVEATTAAVLAAVGTWQFGLTADDRAVMVVKFGELSARMRSLRPWFS
jgi:hypothetical protein